MNEMVEESEDTLKEDLGDEIGIVFSYFGKVGVAAINITSGSLKVGDTIRIHGATTDFNQPVDSMEIDRQKVDSAGVGQSIGIKVKERVRPSLNLIRIIIKIWYRQAIYTNISDDTWLLYMLS